MMLTSDLSAGGAPSSAALAERMAERGCCDITLNHDIPFGACERTCGAVADETVDSCEEEPVPPPEGEVRKRGWIAELGKGFHRRVAQAFGAYASFVYNYGFVILALGVVLAGAMLSGLWSLQYETDFIKLWIEQDSRIGDEKRFVDKYFGATLPRFAYFVTQDRSSDENVVTGRHLDAVLYILQGLFTPESDHFLTMSTPSGKTANHLDFCAQLAEVPYFLKNCPQCTESGDNQYAYLDQGSITSWGYAHVTRCMSDNRATLGSPWSELEPFGLNYTWGVDSFGCQTNTVLDCFQEGNITMPTMLGMLDQPMHSELSSNGYLWGMADLVYQSELQTGCLQGTPAVGQSFKEVLTTHLEATGRSTDIVDAEVSTLKGWFRNFFGMGYRFRTSYKDLTDAQIIAHLDTARKNEMSQMSDATCVLSGSMGGEAFPCCRSNINAQYRSFNDTTSGERVFNSSGDLVRVSAFDSLFAVSNIDHALFVPVAAELGYHSHEERTTAVQDWEQKTIDYLSGAWRAQGEFSSSGQYGDVSLVFMSGRSIEDAAKGFAVVETDLALFGIASLIVLTLVLHFPWSCTEVQRGEMARSAAIMTAGFVAVVLAILCGFGIMGHAGISISPTNIVIPLISLGLGLNDLYIMMHMYNTQFELQRGGGEANRRSSLVAVLDTLEISIQDIDGNVDANKLAEIHLRAALGMSGSSIFMTSFCNTVCFFCTAIAPVLAVQTFSIQMAVTVIMLFSLQFLLVVPILAYAVRHAYGRPIAIFGIYSFTDVVTREGTYVESKEKPPTANHILSSFFVDRFSPLLCQRPVQVIVVLLSLGGLALSLFSAMQLPLGLDVTDFLDENSYFNAYMQYSRDHHSTAIGILVTRDTVEHSSTEVQTSILELQEDLQSSRWVATRPSVRDSSWYSDSSVSLLYSAWDAAGKPDNMSATTILPEESFYPEVKSWVRESFGAFFADVMKCHNYKTKEILPCYDSSPDLRIAATIQPFVIQFGEGKGRPDTTAVLDSIRDTRKRCDRATVDGNVVGFVHGRTYILYDQYLEVMSLMLELCIFALVGIFVPILLFTAQFRWALISILCVCITVIESLGALPLIDIEGNAFSAVNLGVSVGMSVEYVSHFTRAFARHHMIQDPNERLKKCFKETGAPLLSGYLSTFLSIVWLCLSDHKFVQIYFFEMFAVTNTLAFFNGVILLPVLCLFFKPKWQYAAN